MPYSDALLNDLEELIETSWSIRRSKPLVSIQLALEARKISESIDSTFHLALSLRNSGTALYILSQYTEALSQLLEARKLFESINYQPGLADVIRNKGNIYLSLKQYKAALDAYERAKEICESLQDKLGIAYNLGNIGFVKLLLGDYPEAIFYITKTITILEELNDELGLADAKNNLGKAYLKMDNKEKAFHLFTESLRLSSKIDHLRGIANSNMSLGQYYLEIKNSKKSIHHFVNALRSAEKLGEMALTIDIHRKMSDFFEKNGFFDKALVHYKKYEQLKNENETINNQRLIESLKYQFNYEQLSREKLLLQNTNEELEKVNAEMQSKNSELELLSLAASHTDNVILIFDEHFRLEWVNESYKRLTGSHFTEDILEKRPTIFDISTHSNIRAFVGTCLTKKTTVNYESVYYSSNNEKIWFSSTLSPIFNHKHQLKQLMVIETNISELKKHEEIIEKKNKDITDSINYAERIQNSLLPDNRIFESLFKDHFILFSPLNIVSGDFYWLAEMDNYMLVAVIDCTGHGVPGAMMSMITSAFLNSVIRQKNVNTPSEVVKELYAQLNFAFTRYNPVTKTNDGLDISIIEIDKDSNKVRFSGVNRSLFIARKGHITEHKAVRSQTTLSMESLYNLEDIDIDTEENDMLYLFTDGYTDQFGGDKNKKLGTKSFKEILSQTCLKPCHEQKQVLEEFLLSWRGKKEQTDDILVLGLKM